MSLIRGMDSQRRLTIPTETLRAIGAEPGDLLKIYNSLTPEGDTSIILEKFQPGCTFCDDTTEEYVELYGKRICHNCVGILEGDNDVKSC